MRRAVSKKKKEDLQKHREIFLKNGPEHGVEHHPDPRRAEPEPHGVPAVLFQRSPVGAELIAP